MPNQGFGQFNNGGQLDSKAFMAAFSGSSGAYVNDSGSVAGGAYYSNFSSPQPDNLSHSSASVADPAWFVDSSATNHITSNLHNLSIHTPYTGDDKVVVGNGKALPISNIGCSNLYTHQQPVSVISLPNVLHVPSMKKNLLSVSQLTRDHNVIAEFHATSCLIKDKDSRKVLLQGSLKDGLYRLSPTLAPGASNISVHPHSSNVHLLSNGSAFFSCNKPGSFVHEQPSNTQCNTVSL